MTDTTTPAAAPAAAKTSIASKVATWLKTAIAGVIAWGKAKLPGAKAAAAPAVASAETAARGALGTVEADVAASYAAARGNRASWLFVALLVVAGALGGFFGGHAIATRGVSTLKDQIETIKAERDDAQTRLSTKIDALDKAEADLKTANAKIETLEHPTPPPAASTAAAPAPTSAKPVRPRRVVAPVAKAATSSGFPLPFGFP